MKDIKTNINTGLITIPKSDSKKDIDNHKVAAVHFGNAAKNHLDASKFQENGHHEKAIKSSMEAQGHASLANEAQKLTKFPYSPNRSLPEDM